MLENPTEAVNELSFFECIDSVMENSKVELASAWISFVQPTLTRICT